MSSNNTIAFLPVVNTQKNSFNFKELNKLLNEMVLDASKSITLIKDELDEEKIRDCILKSIETTYANQSEKKVKTKRAKQALSSYILFCNEKRSGVKDSNPDMDPKDITRTLANMWRELSDDEKQPYIDESKREAEKLKELANATTDDNNEEKEIQVSTQSEKSKKPKTETKSKMTSKSSSTKSEDDKKDKTKKNEVKVPTIDIDDEEPILKPKSTKTSKK
jgi:hypothetical protein